MADILVAVDGSEQSKKVIDKAVELAKATKSKLILAYVAPKLNVPDEYEQAVDEDPLDQEEYYKQFSDRMLGDLEQRAQKEGVKTELMFGVGNPAQFIVDKAKVRKVSMIVVGLYGLHNLGRLRALGSTSRRVIENSPVPVVAVP